LISFGLAQVSSVVVLGAHPDDIEIAAGGLLLQLNRACPGVRVHYVLLSGTDERHAEAQRAARLFLPDAELDFSLHGLPDGRLPGHWTAAKDIVHEVAARTSPDLVLAPRRDDAHQDHRLVAEVSTQAFRDHLVLAYEIPKWDGDLGSANLYVAVDADDAQTKVELLHKGFPSQHSRDWWDDEVFFGLMRLRGMECKSRYAEAFRCDKGVLRL
jgi:LmbE family N-acetylglucosaminyl deacetylase